MTPEQKAAAEMLLERGIQLVLMMHENDPREPVADNGMTVWDAALVDWARWADMASLQLSAIRAIPLPPAEPDKRDEALRLARGALENLAIERVTLWSPNIEVSRDKWRAHVTNMNLDARVALAALDAALKGEG